MAKIDLVFRQIDERTRDVSLALAMEHIRPDAVHILDDVRPFSECVTQMLRIEHDLRLRRVSGCRLPDP